MAAIYQVSNAITAWDEDDVNQYARTLNNVFGITTDDQDALGRLVLPRGTSLPSSPTAGQTYLKTDVGPNGRLNIRQNGIWIPRIPITQIHPGSGLAADFGLSTSDGTALSFNITTTGGDVLILAHVIIKATKNGVSSVGTLTSFLKRDATSIQRMEEAVYSPLSVGVQIVHTYAMIDSPGGAATYAYNLGGLRDTNWATADMVGFGNDTIGRCRMILLELDN